MYVSHRIPANFIIEYLYYYITTAAAQAFASHIVRVIMSY